MKIYLVCGLRFDVRESRIFSWNAGRLAEKSDYSDTPKGNHIISYDLGNRIDDGRTIFFQLSLDPTRIIDKDWGKGITATIFVDGKPLFSGGYNEKQWDNFINNYLNNLDTFEIGRNMGGVDGRYSYSKMEIYALRLYNRGLTENELLDSYNKTIGYYN